MSTVSINPAVLDTFTSIPEVWIESIFNYLPLSSIIIFEKLNKALRSFSRTVTHPTFLGVYPVSFWSNVILPLLNYGELKKFQQVSKVARRLTLTKRFSDVLFRSDVDRRYKRKLHSVPTENLDVDPHLPAINPLIERTDPSLRRRFGGMKKSDMFKERFQDLSDLNENATQPAFPEIQLKSPFRGWVKVVGHGKPLFGGDKSAVTCRDVISLLGPHEARFEGFE